MASRNKALRLPDSLVTQDALTRTPVGIGSGCTTILVPVAKARA